ncbi:hypothetical protein ACOKFD_07735 [Flagellimonas sp. S174]|uniref:hypothetical protein n=1 Tax=Flagellimonas sp. S174 TaxID=3410790 RepID=UPI003BF615B0
MKLIHTHIIISCLFGISIVKGQNNNRIIENSWQIGLGLGELPTGGSFKPSITIGYHFTNKIYAGLIYQVKDRIERDDSSFNAKSSGLDGLLSSSESVAQRFLAQVRYTPIKYGPYLSGGFVYNGKDTETMLFDSRNREIASESYSGNLEIQETRPAGWGVAFGIGYQYNFKNGLSTGFEWTPAWGQYPEPTYEFFGFSTLSEIAQQELKNRMNRKFRRNVTNMYKVFHLGIAYRFK